MAFGGLRVLPLKLEVVSLHLYRFSILTVHMDRQGVSLMLFQKQSFWGKEFENLHFSQAPRWYRDAAGPWSTLSGVKASNIRAYSWLSELADLLTEAYKGRDNRRRAIKCVAECKMVCAGPWVLRLPAQCRSPGELKEQLCLGATPRDSDSFVLGYSLDTENFQSSPCDFTEQPGVRTSGLDPQQ